MHLWGRSPLWVLRWDLKLNARVNDLSHPSKVQGCIRFSIVSIWDRWPPWLLPLPLGEGMDEEEGEAEEGGDEDVEEDACKSSNIMEVVLCTDDMEL